LHQCRQSSWRSPGVIAARHVEPRLPKLSLVNDASLVPTIALNAAGISIAINNENTMSAERCLGLVEDFRPPPKNNNASHGIVESFRFAHA
jgi:hypothetical protein